MQVIGIFILLAVVWLGFMERDMNQIKVFDPHAMFIILLGSAGAVILGSRTRAAIDTIVLLREVLPGFKRMSKETNKMELERSQISEFWKQGNRAQSLSLAESSSHNSSKELIHALLHKGTDSSVEKHFQELQHAERDRWEAAVHNWEMLSKLGPSFGMVGTITGMIQLFKGMGEDNANIGAAMSLALTATLYGVAFGAGIAGPIANYLRSLLEERLGVLERCEGTAKDLVSVREI
jgi:flagellar motor component MotA